MGGIMYLAVVEIPNTVVGLLGLIITTLGTVVLWQQARADKCAGRYNDLQEKRLEDHQTVISKNDDIIEGFGQQIAVLTEKIESVRDRERARS